MIVREPTDKPTWSSPFNAPSQVPQVHAAVEEHDRGKVVACLLCKTAIKVGGRSPGGSSAVEVTLSGGFLINSTHRHIFRKCAVSVKLSLNLLFAHDL